MEKTKVCIFDAYGTLFDVNAACRELSKEVGEKWEELATLWRLRQVEYTWLRNSMNEYINFWKITENALDYAMDVLNIENEILKNNLLELYLKLEAYPEVENLLKQLKDNGLKTGILSNGNEEMLESAVRNAKIENLIDEVISVERCKVFKPSSKVYDLVKDAFNVNKNDVAFFSSNAWDMHAAANYGFKTIWVNRFNSKLERLPGKPEAIVKNLDGIVQIL
ncbi:haloacid dehalogenase type II [Alphaproteobacteria bacterium]|nr:haloacid dehalogenase type II [Alphaproteobacteria bacterium]MDC1023150.1 haloacid dehalogenase type II [Alphaproteobacteria bacterium]